MSLTALNWALYGGHPGELDHLPAAVRWQLVLLADQLHQLPTLAGRDALITTAIALAAQEADQ